ncbi:MAG: OmpH family outer membrane protein [Brumimicrobium sp.]|nr:OmpH family outer membrane protein [Brumimicrobium sp.]MCO5268817.1 OmpH family outer membrane protein [Brumimicrobium sp.]
MKKVLSLLLVITVITLSITSCKDKPGDKGKEAYSGEVNIARIDTGSIAMAFYVQDSITTQFNFYREIDSMLKAKELVFQKELETKIRAYQAFEADVQKRMDNNEITGYQLEDIQRTAMQKQQAIQQFQEEKGAALQKESYQYTTAMMNKISEAGREFSQENNIDLLFFYQKGGQITYINNAYNVTAAFISFLNQREDELKSGFDNEVKSLEKEASQEVEGLGIKK